METRKFGWVGEIGHATPCTPNKIATSATLRPGHSQLPTNSALGMRRWYFNLVTADLQAVLEGVSLSSAH